MLGARSTRNGESRACPLAPACTPSAESVELLLGSGLLAAFCFLYLPILRYFVLRRRDLGVDES